MTLFVGKAFHLMNLKKMGYVLIMAESDNRGFDVVCPQPPDDSAKTKEMVTGASSEKQGSPAPRRDNRKRDQ